MNFYQKKIIIKGKRGQILYSLVSNSINTHKSRSELTRGEGAHTVHRSQIFIKLIWVIPNTGRSSEFSVQWDNSAVKET